MRKNQEKNSFKISGRTIQIIVSLVVFSIIFYFASFLLFGSEPIKPSPDYKVYNITCSKNEAYFENISASMNLTINKTSIIDLKKNSSYCNINEADSIPKALLENFTDEFYCDCIEWKSQRECQKGFVLEENNFCFNEKIEKYTLASVPCSRFLCKDGIIVENPESYA